MAPAELDHYDHYTILSTHSHQNKDLINGLLDELNAENKPTTRPASRCRER